MGLDACVANGIKDVDPEAACNSLSNGIAISENGSMEPTKLMELISLLNMELAYFSEKLVNLDLLMTIVSLGEIGLGELSIQNNNISDVEIEKALIFDLSFGYLDSEITELASFLEILQAKMMDAQQEICSFKKRKDIFTVFQAKLQASENSWIHLQEQMSELKRQLVNFHRTLSLIRNDSMYSIEIEDFERSNYDMQIAGQQRYVLSMLEKSLAAELNLEKQLLESKRIEKELNSKLILTNDVVLGMESFLDVVLERLLEAEHSSQVYKGFAKETMSRFQICEFNMHCSVHREEELKSKLQNSLERLKERESAEVKLKEVEEKLKASESKLQEVKASYEVIQEQLSMVEDTNESLREHLFMVETRADEAEEKLVTLTEENAELREELGFLKGGDSNGEKIGLLEKQVRDLDVKLQTSKCFADASLEQQSMLYTAIWDMETLIEELKSKVSKAESKVESAHKECLDLAETNVELNKQIGYLKDENGKLVDNQKEVNKLQVAREKEIKNLAKVFNEMAVQLAIERERLQKQLSSLARENTILLEELRKTRKNLLGATQSKKDDDKKDIDTATDDPATGISTELANTEEVVETSTTATASNQVDEVVYSQVYETSDKNTHKTEATAIPRSHDVAMTIVANCTDHEEAEAAGSSRSGAAADSNITHENAASRTSHENVGKMKNKQFNKKSCLFAAVFVVGFSVLVMNVDWLEIYHIMRRQYIRFE
ncbi:WPP domain-interacting tail-anchored protein 2-like isoform X2 [Amaranthus tricolor]|nr:WPP domain-interacting tail-anchored protein 2-like isoform X2 [Amaranthus tricolor]